MRCRRCGKDIADGSEMCPVCGISQKTHITPRDFSSLTVKKKKKRSRGSIISMIAMILAVTSVFVMIFLSGRETEKVDFQKVVDAYDAGDEDILVLAVGQFMKNHPNSSRVEEAQAYLNRIRGIDDSVLDSEPDDADAAAERIRLAEIERLKERAPDSILRVESVVLGDTEFDDSHKLTIYWRNMSDKVIKEIYFKVYAYDTDGNKVNCENRERPDITARAANDYLPNPTEDVYRNVWLKAWYGSSIDHVKIDTIKIYYEDNTEQTLPEEVVEAITQSAT